jgi:type I restriction enzyme R subunit
MSTTGPEYCYTEAPTLRQLEAMAELPGGLGWTSLIANPQAANPPETDDQGILLRESFRDVVLWPHLRRKLRDINLDDNGQPWLDDRRVTQAMDQLLRLGSGRLMDKNETATNRLLSGVNVEGLQGKNVTINLIDFDHPERNSFLAISQFRVDPPGVTGPVGSHRPDIILFVNGIPLVVIECKAPGTDTLNSGIQDLLKYSNQRGSLTPEGIESLFYTNQLMISCTSGRAVVGTVGSKPKHFLEWKDTHPFDAFDLAQRLGIQQPTLEPGELVGDDQADDLIDTSGLTRRQQLVAGMLHPINLLDIIRHYTLYDTKHGRRIKIVPRYMQFRAVYKAIDKLRTGQTKAQHGQQDQRGGIIWHYQGSGKSFDMVFLLRKLRTIPDLQAFKVVIITDRTELEDQLSGTAALSGQSLQKAKSIKDLAAKLRIDGPGLIFGMIQKFRKITGDEPEADINPSEDTEDNYTDIRELNQALNPSENILLIVDEAHRSHGSILHAFLDTALPNAAKIGFTGTPIIAGKKKKTKEIFGDFIDIYSIRDSQKDGVTVPILYEGLESMGAVKNADLVDQLFDVLFPPSTYSEDDRAKIRAKVSKTDIRQAKEMMQAKARHMLHHYLTRVMPAGFKAQLAASSRQACVDYQTYLCAARDDLIRQLESNAPILERLTLETAPEQYRSLLQAYPYLEDLRRLDFAAIISGNDKKDPASWKVWTDENNHTQYKNRFWQPLSQDGMAILIVQNKLLVGFDAPIEQVLYVDRNLVEDGLLQAIARTNRTAEGKTYGLIVDYYGIDIATALAIYEQDDVDQAVFDLQEEIPKLSEAHRRVMNFWAERSIDINGDLEACANILYDERPKAEFYELLRVFLKRMDAFFPRPEALRYYPDAKRLGQIKKLVDDIYRDEVPEDTKAKIQNLVDQFVESQGIQEKIGTLDILSLDLTQQPRRRRSAQTNAAEMEHALRHHIRTHFNDDPVYYAGLSQRIDELLQRLGEDWDAREGALRAMTQQVQAEQTDTSHNGHQPNARIRPFYNALLASLEAPSEATQTQLQTIATALLDYIATCTKIPNFWTDLASRGDLRNQIWLKLEETSLFPDSKLDSLADQITQLAERHNI